MFGSMDGLILNGEEFIFWKIAVMAAFEGDDLGTHLESSTPPHNLPAKEKKEWVIRDRLGFGYLFRTLTSRDKHLVQHCRSCFELFTTLQTRYEVNESSQVALINQLIAMPYPSSTVDKIVIDMVNLKARFDTSEDRISDATFILLTVQKLPDSLKKFKESCLNKTLKFANFNEFALQAISKGKAEAKEQEEQDEKEEDEARKEDLKKLMITKTDEPKKGKECKIFKNVKVEKKIPAKTFGKKQN